MIAPDWSPITGEGQRFSHADFLEVQAMTDRKIRIAAENIADGRGGGLTADPPPVASHPCRSLPRRGAHHRRWPGRVGW